MKPARVFIADNCDIVRLGVKTILNDAGIYEVCGEANEGRTALEEVQRLAPDLVVLEVALPLMHGLEVARRIAARTPKTGLIFFTDIESEDVMRESLLLGIKGFVSKCDRASHLLSAIDAVLHNRTFYTSRMTDILFNFATRPRSERILTGREREIVQLVAEGRCNKDVAKLLGISIKTVETHRSNLMQKLRLHSTAELTMYAVRNYIIGAFGAGAHVNSSLPKELILRAVA